MARTAALEKPKKLKEPNASASEHSTNYGHVVHRKFVAYGQLLKQGVRVDATNWPKLIALTNAGYLRAATLADVDRPFVDVPAKG